LLLGLAPAIGELHPAQLSQDQMVLRLEIRMRKTLEQKIATAERQLVRLKEDERRADTRRKILVGAIVLDEAGRNIGFARWLIDRLRTAKRPADIAALSGLIEQLEAKLHLPKAELLS
jgi:hypothetical protein